jgi:hypothetical protein
VIFSILHSGSIRHYGGRMTLRFDLLDPDWLDRAVAWLQASGRHPYLVVEGTESEEFGRRFAGHSRLAALNWLPIAAMRRPAVLTIYDLAHVEADHPLRTIAPDSDALSSRWPCAPPARSSSR